MGDAPKGGTEPNAWKGRGVLRPPSTETEMLFDPRTPPKKFAQNFAPHSASRYQFRVGDVVHERDSGRTGVVIDAHLHRIEARLDCGGTRGCNARHFELAPAPRDDSYR